MDKAVEKRMLEILDSMKKNSIQISYDQASEPLKAVCSKFGGKPQLPEDFKWPYYEGKSYNDVTANRSLSFLAQINLSQVSELDSDSYTIQ